MGVRVRLRSLSSGLVLSLVMSRERKLWGRWLRLVESREWQLGTITVSVCTVMLLTSFRQSVCVGSRGSAVERCVFSLLELVAVKLLRC